MGCVVSKAQVVEPIDMPDAVSSFHNLPTLLARYGDAALQPVLEGEHVASEEGWGNMGNCHVSSAGDAALDRGLSGGGSIPVLNPPDMEIAHHACAVCGRQGVLVCRDQVRAPELKVGSQMYSQILCARVGTR